MVQVVSHVPDVHVLEHFAICSKDAVHPGLDLSFVPLYYPRGPILQTWLLPWEEEQIHANQPQRHKIVFNGLNMRCAFRLHQVGIDISGHQELGPIRLIPDSHINVLYGQSIS